ncbi:MAG TPA: hypothetical protein P5519_06925 [Spirochaetia bacterium]|nr:hypothetical protein [Spirochaetales bacterium]HOT59616.1 hypothetical protein [Spirochaetales bacterium]HQG39665.1 hypothetical protein [Spirochaetales bacterium]HRS65605.1 hypothetical protein [Spirochaetia bacterium]
MSDSQFPFAWTHGAIWLLHDGTIYTVPGFHDEWIKQHQDLVPGCTNVSDVILTYHWISVVTYAKNYIEVMIDSRKNMQSIDTALTYLGLHLEKWENTLLMAMQEDYYEKISVEDFNNLETLKIKLRGSE